MAESLRWRVPLRAPLPDGEPHDPPAYLSLIHNWDLDETFTLGDRHQRRIVAIESTTSFGTPGSKAIFYVEPL